MLLCRIYHADHYPWRTIAPTVAMMTTFGFAPRHSIKEAPYSRCFYMESCSDLSSRGGSAAPTAARITAAPATRLRAPLQQKRSTSFEMLLYGIRQRPILPGRVQPSTFGTEGLNFCVRNGNRWNPFVIATGNGELFTLPVAFASRPSHCSTFSLFCQAVSCSPCFGASCFPAP